MAIPRLEFHPAALSESRNAVSWYRSQSPKVALAFAVELEQAVDSVQETPDRWPRHLHGTRRLLLKRFPYGVVYHADVSRILIVAIAHFKRKPGYWKDRR